MKKGEKKRKPPPCNKNIHGIFFRKTLYLIIFKHYTENKIHQKETKLYQNFTKLSIFPFFALSAYSGNIPKSYQR
jgi:hypothetical protein